MLLLDPWRGVDPEIDVFRDREAYSSKSASRPTRDFPISRFVLEHLSSVEGVQVVPTRRRAAHPHALITPHADTHLRARRRLAPTCIACPLKTRAGPRRARKEGATSGERLFPRTDSSPRPIPSRRTQCRRAAACSIVRSRSRAPAQFFAEENAPRARNSFGLAQRPQTLRPGAQWRYDHHAREEHPHGVIPEGVVEGPEECALVLAAANDNPGASEATGIRTPLLSHVMGRA